MSTSAPCIGIAIVSYNTRELLRACLNSLGTCRLPLRIVVVDNQSRDGSAAMLRSSFPHVELLEPGRNLGFAAGTNLALRTLLQQGTCDYLLLLNSDTIVHAGAIEALLAFLEAHPRVGMLGPRLLNTDGSVQAAAFRFPTLSMLSLIHISLASTSKKGTRLPSERMAKSEAMEAGAVSRPSQA